MIRRDCPSCHRARRTSDTYPTLISNKEARWLNGNPFLVSAASGSDAGIQHARPLRTAFRCGPSSLSRHAGQLFHVEPAEGFCEAASTLPFRRWLASNAQRRNFDTTEISHMRNRHLHWARARAVYGRDRPRPASALSPGNKGDVVVSIWASYRTAQGARKPLPNHEFLESGAFVRWRRCLELLQASHRPYRCLLWHHGEHLAAPGISLPCRTDLAQVVGTTDARKSAHLGHLQRVPRPPPPASSQDHPPLHLTETNLSREEPNASIAHVRDCGGRGW
jgi:hypothetical protein